MPMTDGPAPAALDAAEFARQLASRFEDAGPILAAELSELVGLSLIGGAKGAIVLNCVHDFLLRRTVAHAVDHVPRYREDPAYRTWRDTTPGARPDLGCFPVIDRRHFQEPQARIVADNVQLRSICHTSGTTGQPVQIFKSFEEIDFLQAYFQAFVRASTRRMTRKPITFSMPNVYHGSPVPMPSPGLGLVGGVTDDTLVADALRVLEKRYDLKGYDERVSTLSGLGHHVLFLTSFMMEQGKDPKDLGLRAVNTTGGYLGTRWRRFLRDAWGPIVNDRFSLTETVAGASRLGDSETFVLDPHIFAEVVDLDDGDKQSDVGRLVLTNLYPFVIMQPLIRYETGDIVARVDGGPGNTLCFDYLGRRKNCVSLMVDGRREWLVFSARLNDVLGEITDIRVYDWFSNVRSARDRTVGSLPIMTLARSEEGSVLRLDLRIELGYAPHTHLRRVEALRAEITAALRAVPRTTLAQRMDDGRVRLDITFLPPGGLETAPEIKI